jgi:Domain of unknown function (DUF4037)
VTQPFVPGIDLARAFYENAVARILQGTPHAAALLGWGSDVLGFDTARSVDHGWGPRLSVFVEPTDVAGIRAAVDAGLPETFRGWPTRYGWDEVPVSHHVEVESLPDWLRRHLGFDPEQGVALANWLGTPQQLLLEVTAGAVFHDDTGRLTAVRKALAWYPDELWRWLLACQWRRIDQEEPFVGRTAEAGDELGSRVLTGRLARDLMRLGFLVERRYAPYGKWLGSAFARLEMGAAVGRLLSDALAAADYPAREAALTAAAVAVAERHNALGVPPAVEPSLRLFFTRPYRVLGAARFVDACLDSIADPRLRSLPLVGAIDQFVDSTDVLSYPTTFTAIGAVYERWLNGMEEVIRP